MYQPSEDNQPKRSKASQESNQDRIRMGELAECMLEVLKNNLQTDSEPFEHYAQELRLRLNQDVKSFRERFAQGYEALLETLQSMSKSKS